MGKQVHLGAGLWDRGNLILGLYGMWDASTETDDRRQMRMDIGLLVTNDGMHYREPLPDFRIIDAGEDGWNSGNPTGDPPRLSQGQGMENVGDKTLTWYGIWGPGGGSSVRLATWQRDRLGYFCVTSEPLEGQKWRPELPPHVISAPIRLAKNASRVYLNADVFGQHGQITVEVLDERFRPLPDYSGKACIPVTDGGLRIPVKWRDRERVETREGSVRVRVNFGGIRPEDCRMYTVYVASE
jgi:hypothetical protein